MKPLDRFHPAEDRLIALYFGDEATDADERRAVRQHLHGCETCTWRYTELTAPLERLRQDAASEADEVFTPSRLDAQRAQIMRRLETGAAEPRVIPFPSAVSRLDRSAVHRPLARWIAGAAAAGLLIGLMGGRLIDFRVAPGPDLAPAPPIAALKSAVPQPRPVIVEPVSNRAGDGDEAFLTELDQAVYRQRVAELSALDEMTPHVVEAGLVARSIR